MLVPLRRFGITAATAILSTARRKGIVPRVGRSLAGAAFLCGLPCAAAPPQPDTPDTAAGLLFAAGDTAAERGWFGAARSHWRAAARDAAARGDSTTAERAAARTASLDAMEQDLDREIATRDRAAAATWSAADWPVSWRAAAGPAACGIDAGHPPVTIANGLVVWNTGRALHAVAMSDGRPRWHAADDRDSCLFPRGVGGPPSAPTPACTLEPAAAATAGGRAYAVIDQGRDGHLLVCLDLSDAAEGRLAWCVTAADAAAREPRSGAASFATSFDGPPVVDHGFCCIVIRTDDARGSLALASFDARDGSPLWTRSLGPGVAVDGVDRARGRRQPCLVEDRIVVDTHAGMVHAFDRDGATAWAGAAPGSGAGPDGTACISPPRFAHGRLLLAPVDGTGIVAVDPRDGSQTWRWRAGDAAVTAVLGCVAHGLVVATRTGSPAITLLRRLAIDDGRATATSPAAAQPAGNSSHGVVSGGTIFWPVAAADAAADGTAPRRGLQIEVLDAVTLQRRRPPVDCRPAGDATDTADTRVPGPRLAVSSDCLVIANGTITCLRPAPSSGPGTSIGPSPQ